MAENSKIEWTDHTWSPWEGCTKVGPGCDHCYAESMNRWLRKGANWGPGAPRRAYSDEHWEKPLRWNAAAKKAGKRLRVFPSVCDPFDNEVPIEWRARFFDLIGRTPNIDWLLLTKRIGNVRGMLDEVLMASATDNAIGNMLANWLAGNPPQNIWLGATVVNQEEADRDIPKLLATPAAVRFLSCEPLLGPLDLRYLQPGDPPTEINALAGTHGVLRPHRGACDRIDWVIVGGESGPGARSMVLGWAKEIVRQCQAADVPVMVKQMGARPTNREGEPHPQKDRKGGDMAEWPEVLRVREFPRNGPTPPAPSDEQKD